ncbi:metal-sulfur cluster assembly factor [Leuconostoc suionicum]|uniref:metal-sulfur cluster assembly factor n=1 Tax=Leuconostoc suionicum TaxID=1511761 RepID=UPI0024AE4D67|nr:metal-sulfur cluster assembly factor [Leuconostoc suionicum]MDI6523179.1 metal-sulfur cluster assembly factor [Leuconostoc suionicum]
MENKTQELQDQMLEALSQVIDPELRCDIVSLGLVYGLAMDENGHVTVKLTLTTMGCPLTAVLDTMITRALLATDAVNSVKIDLVWEPAWSPDRMSRYAKMVLGVHS